MIPGLLNFVRPILYLAFLVGSVLLIIYVFAYRPFVSDLSEKGGIHSFGKIRHVSASTHRRLGSVKHHSMRHFTRFSAEKSPGTLRLCALGDSNTAGTEVGSKQDYPSYLQRQLERQGAHNVEVINFGNGWGDSPDSLNR